MNITLSIEDEIVKKVRKIAIDKNTTLTAMVREYLTEVAKRDNAAREELVVRFEDSIRRLSRDMGPRNWTRDDLYDRFSDRQSGQ